MRLVGGKDDDDDDLRSVTAEATEIYSGLDIATVSPSDWTNSQRHVFRIREGVPRKPQSQAEAGGLELQKCGYLTQEFPVCLCFN